MREDIGSESNLTLLEKDVSSDADCSASITETERSFGEIDGLLHLGAAHSSGRWDELEAEEMKRTLAINVTVSFQISRAVAEYMKECGNGSIVLTTSASVMFGVTKGQGGPAYVGSKGVVLALMRSLTRSRLPDGIRVSAVSPGITGTPMVAGYSEQQNTSMLQRFPLCRFAEPSEIAVGAIFLISCKASCMTGEDMHINGGSNFGG